MFALVSCCGQTVLADDPAAVSAKPVAKTEHRKTTAKPLSDNVKSGLAWLIKQQQPGGGWGQGEESRNMGGGGEMKDVANVADTSMAAMALIRAGSTPKEGLYAESLRKAVDFICKEIEGSDTDSIFITNIRNTRVQTKLGATIDTFAATLLLAEVKDRMPDEASRTRVAAALAKTMRKIEKNQQKDGTWAKDGWAAALCQGMASKALNVAAQKGVAVNEAVRTNAEKYAQGQFVNGGGSGGRGDFKPEGAAGVKLYAAASTVNSLRQSDSTNSAMEPELQRRLASASTQPREQREIRDKLRAIDENRKQLAQAEAVVVNKMDDPQFVAGFGSNGGEEFLSHLNIGESLVQRGGAEWDKWDKAMTQNMNRVQNDDGSWSGHHCITGRTFCTSAALLVLMADRSATPVSATISKKS